MHKMNHLIEKQVLEIETGGPVKDWHFQREIRDWYYRDLLPQMEQLFDRYGGADNLIRMDSCSIEARISDSDRWQEELSHALLQQLALQLRQSEKHRLPGQGTGARDGDAEAALLYFMEKGCLPWYATGKAIPELEERILLSSGIRVFRRRFLRLILSRETFLRRAILQCSDAFLEKLFAFTAGSRPPDTAIGEGGDSSSSAMKQRLRSWKEAILKTAEEEHLLPSSYPERHQQPQRERQSPREPGGDPQEAFKTDPPEMPAGPDVPYYVDNAGLVLLHPFLEECFRRLELYGKLGFVDPEAHCRAVLLTQYMVRPQRLSGEYDLMLNKILCGFPPEQTLPASIDISAEEGEEINGLLQTVIRSWKMRGVQVNTSIDNLRSAFLERNGKLSRSSSGWHLQVEQEPWDMVLGSLPWGIGRIESSWMGCLLTVDWQ